MRVNVTFRHTNSSKALKDYSEEKVQKLEKYLHKPLEAHVILSVEKIRHIAEVNITAAGHTIFGREVTEDLYSAIDQVVDKLEKQVRRHKDRVVSQKKSAARSAGPKKEARKKAADAFRDSDKKSDGRANIIRTNNVRPKPMTVEDALLDLEVEHEDLLVFKNSSTGKINVLYNMKDGNVGLIEPE